ncbi:uncharacterized protein LOC121858438 [Homarus americanus]|uniref:uncharacterized protein LOC121858438 n=1 Tax=Homarus americanus TaxID=6706 RepID=UPI001C4795B0|nr:uncharacterized protein LOC121858438 [Homarus americanus]
MYLRSLLCPVVALVIFLSLVTGVNVNDSLPAPWSNPEVCGSPQDPTRNIQGDTLCDPDRILSRMEYTEMAKKLKKCREDAGTDTHVIVFLAANASFPDDSGKGDKIARVNTSSGERLLKKVVTSYDLTNKSPVILVVAVKEPFQIVEWVSSSLTSVLAEEDRQVAMRAAGSIHEVHQHFSTSIFHTLHSFCEVIHWKHERYTTKWIILTVTWIVFVVAFLSGLVVIIICFIKARRSRFKNAPPPRPQGTERSNPGRTNANPLSGDMHELTTLSYRTTEHVLLGTTDITAVASHSCASTDNLLSM